MFSPSVVSDSLRPHGLQHARLSCPSLSSQNLLKLMSIESMMPSSHLILCHSLLLSIFLSIRVFPNESGLCIRWSKYWSFHFSISPANKYSGLISSRMDWFDLLAVEETLESLLQHHSSKPSVFRCSTFFMIQLSHVYMTTGKTIALCLWRFILIFGKTNTIMQSFKNKIKLKKKKELSAKKRKTNKQTNHSFDYVQFCQPQRGPG